MKAMGVSSTLDEPRAAPMLRLRSSTFPTLSDQACSSFVFPSSNAEVCLQVYRLRAAVHLLQGRCAVAIGLASGAIEDLTTITWSQNVMRVGEWITPLSVTSLVAEVNNMQAGELTC